MTTVWRTQEEVPPSPLDPVNGGWISGLGDVQVHLAEATLVLDARAGPGLMAIEQAWRALSAASDSLMTALVGCGVGTPLGWRLHNLRNRLDSHLLAADALRDADAADAVITVLRRTVDFIGVELEALLRES